MKHPCCMLAQAPINRDCKFGVVKTNIVAPTVNRGKLSNFNFKIIYV